MIALALSQHYLGTLALEEEKCGQWAACSELVPGAFWESLARGGDALGPSSTWHDADTAGAQLHPSVPHLSPCKSINLASFSQPCQYMPSLGLVVMLCCAVLCCAVLC